MSKMITVEFSGVDGSGKTTAVEYLAEYLRSKGLRVAVTREVGSPHIPTAVKLREIVLGLDSDMTGAEMELVFAAMRLMNARLVKRWADSGEYDVVLSDRGWADHIVYTCQNVDAEFAERLYNHVPTLRDYRTDLEVYLQVSAETAAQRRVSRGRAKDAIEAKGDEFLNRVIDGFDGYFADESPNQFVVDANTSLEAVQTQLRILADRLVADRNRDTRYAQTGLQAPTDRNRLLSAEQTQAQLSALRNEQAFFDKLAGK